MNKLEIKKGDKFNKLTVLNELPKQILPSGQSNRLFLCRCDCGKQKKVRLLHLKRGRVKSCGCISNIQPTKELKYIRKIWRAIKYRTSENYNERHLYYDKGIVVCDEWVSSFENFKQWALTNGLKKGTHIDRIDSNGNYEPSNCRVATPTENANNRENTFIVNYKGIDYPIMNLLRDKNMLSKEYTIRARIKRGWSVEKAFDKPININYRKSI